MKVVLDCDNTMGINDVDDAMALFYLLGKSEVELLAITTTHGNNQIDVVHQATRQLLKDIQREDIALYKGSGGGAKESDAAHALVNLAQQYRGELCILAVGALTNLYAASRIDPSFWGNLKQIVLMGGITEELIVGSSTMDELNFSVDACASTEVLQKGRNISILTGNNCLATLFSRDEFTEHLEKGEQGRYILEKTAYWFNYNEEKYDLPGFYNWDITAAIYLVRPQLFEDAYGDYDIQEAYLTKGRLVSSQNRGNARLNLPRIKDVPAFKQEAYSVLAGGKD